MLCAVGGTGMVGGGEVVDTVLVPRRLSLHKSGDASAGRRRYREVISAV